MKPGLPVVCSTRKRQPSAEAEHFEVDGTSVHFTVK